MKEKMDELENKKNNLTIDFNEARIQFEMYSPKIDNIKYLGKDADIKTKEFYEQKEIINRYIKKVLLYEDEIEIHYIVDFLYGGGGSRTHVRKYFHKTFSECRPYFFIRFDCRLWSGCNLCYLQLFCIRSKNP